MAAAVVKAKSSNTGKSSKKVIHIDLRQTTKDGVISAENMVC